MNAADNIFLVGPMGAGKTTIGRHLAKILQRTFVDLDTEIEARCGAGIPWIFDREGERGFRDREAALLAELAGREGLVVATGGGVVLRPQNRLTLKDAGVVVFLSVTARELFERTRNDTHRPLLQVPNRREVVERLASERDPLYREVADLVYCGGRRGPKVAAEEIAGWIATLP
jgi:shikimate kinase